MDFKGWWTLRNGQICYPLTISDLATRFLVRVQALESQRTDLVDAILSAAFREYGLPLRIRSDNGPPFASTTLGGLSRLGVKLMRLGITHERIEPGKPQQNGSHERMHKTLKQEVTSRGVASCMGSQQRDFDEILKEFNHVRPHEALGQVPPARLFTGSCRPYPEILPEPVYPDSYSVRVVGESGQFRYLAHQPFLTKVLTGQLIGLCDNPSNDRLVDIWFCSSLMAHMDKKSGKVLGAVEMPS